MKELRTLITEAQNGDGEAFNEIVRRFQDMAVAYAYSLVGDFHLAEDAAQEAFIEAFLCLSQLREPLAFPSWLRRIVFKHCDRLTRSKKVFVVALDSAAEEISDESAPQNIMESCEASWQLRKAIAALPQNERDVTTLFYMAEYSQNQIAEFLEVPVTTVKKRLYTARKKLKEKVIKMIQENFEDQRPSRNSTFAIRVASFTTQFSQMIDGGQSIVRSLAFLAEQEPNAQFRQIISQIQQDITGNGQEGATLSEAMAKHRALFSEAYVHIIEQGERNENLAAALRSLGSS